jgi:hypothetical protein
MPLDVNTTLATGRLYGGLSPLAKRRVYAALLCDIVKTYAPTFNCGTVANGCVSCLSPQKLAFLQAQLLCLLNRVTTPTFGCDPETIALANPCVGCLDPNVILTLATTLASQSFLTLSPTGNLNPSALLDANPCIACLDGQPLEVEIALLLMAWLGQFQTVNLTSILAQCDCLIASMPGGPEAFSVNQLATLATNPPASAPVGPTLPVFSNLVSWWNADSLALANNDPVISWTDGSGLANTLVQGTAGFRPLFKTNVVNGKPAVRFDGTDDFLNMTNTLTLGLIWSWLVVESNTSGAGVISIGGSVNGDGFEHNAFNAKICRVLSTAGSVSGTFTAAESVWKCANAIANKGGSITSIRENKVERGTGTSQTPTVNCVGQRSGGSFFVGDIAEIIIYAANRTPAEMDTIFDSYLQPKYNL